MKIRVFRRLLKENHPGLYAVIDAAGTAHSKGMKSYLIMMAVRLLELRRVLKDTGSLYLHCDPTASHYLKLTLDAIFGQDNSRSEIIWKRTSAHNDAKVMGAVHDCILYYTATNKFTFNSQYVDYGEKYVEKRYKHQDKDGRKWMDDNLTAKG